MFGLQQPRLRRPGIQFAAAGPTCLSIRRAILETAAKQESIVVVGVTEIPTLIVPNRETRFVQG